MRLGGRFGGPTLWSMAKWQGRWLLPTRSQVRILLGQLSQYRIQATLLRLPSGFDSL